MCDTMHATDPRSSTKSCFAVISLLACCGPLVCSSVAFGEETRGLINDSTTYRDLSHYRSLFGEVQDAGTTHVSVLDPSGLAVSVTR